jgi:DNA polymerase
MTDRRNAVFLEEMGVGPQWRLRSRPVPNEVAADDAVAAAPMPAPQAPAAAAAVEAQPATRQPAPAAPLQPAPPAMQPVIEQAPAGGLPESASGPNARPVPQAEPRRPLATPSIASTGEDMSWFDEAPTPEFKPQRKKAAPEAGQASTAQPQRPAPAAAPVRQAPPARTDEAPAYDEAPPAWFDDDQAAPVPSHEYRAAMPDAGGPPTAGRATDEAIARMDWPALQAAIGACTRCPRCETRQQAVPGRGDEQASWLALDTAPGSLEDAEGYQFAGDPGYLLDNMLKAVGQTTGAGAYLTSLVKCHAPHAPGADELQACRPYLQRELELTQAKVIVAFGHSAGKGLLGSAARGRIMMHGSVPVVATYHPADLLKKPEEKGKAWQDLCLAKAAHAGRR